MAKLLEILIKENVLTKDQALSVRKQAKEGTQRTEEILYALGVAQEEVQKAKSEELGVPIAKIEISGLSFDVLKDIPEESAKYYDFVPIGKDGDTLRVGMLYPEDIRAHEALKFIAGRLGVKYKVFLITPSDFEKTLKAYKSLGSEVTAAVSAFEEEVGKKQPAGYSERRVEEAGEISTEAPVTKMMSVILRYAVEGNASDIHIEPIEDKVKVRFRVDGVLYAGLFLPKSVHSALVTKIKVLTNMKIDESRVPQDGRFRERVLDRDIDFRVSTMPTHFGEKVAIRILDTSAGGELTFKNLGLEGRNLEILQRNIDKPYGMILITGPTGSGKSTTLYTILKSLDRNENNVVSLEDPVEYFIEGVNQSQVRPEIGFSFASGLRSILRQDPDIIMVGEIRDKETAELAVHSALTGHLVLSTLHTNNAIGVIPRLIDMGIDPFLIPSTLILAIAQRLARTLCADSKKEVLIEGAAKEIIEKETGDMPGYWKEEMTKVNTGHIYEAQQNPTCPKGTRGRVGLFEVLEMTPELEKKIIKGASEGDIVEEAKRQNMITLKQDGVMKVLRGLIGMDELLEVS